jgi:hypothetical protein|tara:strand:+ start:447 stop:815 length:369 start_codon:yes stop_codon:yes gene_type:complete
MSRPTKYTPLLLARAKEYLESYTTAIPSHIGLAYYLNIANSTMYAWAKEEDKKEFSEILERIMQLQFIELTDKGLTGDFNSAITKLALGKHGYTDKVDQTSSDGSMTPPTTINLVAKEFENL